MGGATEGPLGASRPRRCDCQWNKDHGAASLPGDPAAGPPFSRTGMRCTTERYGAAGAPLGPRAPAGQGIPIILFCTLHHHMISSYDATLGHYSRRRPSASFRPWVVFEQEAHSKRGYGHGTPSNSAPVQVVFSIAVRFEYSSKLSFSCAVLDSESSKRGARLFL